MEYRTRKTTSWNPGTTQPSHCLLLWREEEGGAYNCQRLDFFFSWRAGLSFDALRLKKKKECTSEEVVTSVSSRTGKSGDQIKASFSGRICGRSCRSSSSTSIDSRSKKYSSPVKAAAVAILPNVSSYLLPNQGKLHHSRLTKLLSGKIESFSG